MLTRKQRDLLLFIHARLSEEGISPSYEEMKDALGLKSKSGVHRLIDALEERGFLKRLPHRARAIEILRLPTDMQPEGTVEQRGGLSDMPERSGAAKEDASNVIPGPFPSRSGSEDDISTAVRTALEAPEIQQLPLYGRIAAGTPIEALRDEAAMVDVPSAMLGRGDFYALEVEGDSMIEAGIHDGDTVIIRRTDRAETGDIVVALIDGHEATLKRLRKRNDSIALEPANAAYETRIFGPDSVQVQGCLAALLRRY